MENERITRRALRGGCKYTVQTEPNPTHNEKSTHSYGMMTLITPEWPQNGKVLAFPKSSSIKTQIMDRVAKGLLTAGLMTTSLYEPVTTPSVEATLPSPRLPRRRQSRIQPPDILA